MPNTSIYDCDEPLSGSPFALDVEVFLEDESLMGRMRFRVARMCRTQDLDDLVQTVCVSMVRSYGKKRRPLSQSEFERIFCKSAFNAVKRSGSKLAKLPTVSLENDPPESENLCDELIKDLEEISPLLGSKEKKTLEWVIKYNGNAAKAAKSLDKSAATLKRRKNTLYKKLRSMSAEIRRTPGKSRSSKKSREPPTYRVLSDRFPYLLSTGAFNVSSRIARALRALRILVPDFDRWLRSQNYKRRRRKLEVERNRK